MAGESDAEQEGHGAHGADGRVEHRPAVPERRGDGPRGGEEGAGWGGATDRLRGWRKLCAANILRLWPVGRHGTPCT